MEHFFVYTYVVLGVAYKLEGIFCNLEGIKRLKVYRNSKSICSKVIYSYTGGIWFIRIYSF